MSKRSLINGKVYLSCDKIGDNYFECFYCFFREGSIVRTGVEDFSLERLKSCTKLYNVRIFKGLGAVCGSSGRRYTDSTNLYLLADKSVTMASLSCYIVDNDEIFGFARLERCYSGYATNLFQFSSAWGSFIARVEEYPEKIADCTNDITEDATSDATEDTSDTTEDTSDTTEDTKDTPIIFVDKVQTYIHVCREISFSSADFLPVPRWFYQRANIYIWSAVLAAYKYCYGCDRRKRVIVKPVRLVYNSFYPVRVSPYGMPTDYYPYKLWIDGKEVWDCRSRSYNEYLSDLVGAPPYDELPF